MPSDTSSVPDARPWVEQFLDEAARRRASDIHLEPTAQGYDLRYRVDGLLHTVSQHDVASGRSFVTRLMVMARLLTYRMDVPQEGRITVTPPSVGRSLDLRLAVMPTIHGLRAVVRLPADLTQARQLGDLGLPAAVLDGLHRFARADAGMLLLVGPAGSGKTTTIYALLQHIAAVNPGQSIIALEDPVERQIPAGVTQIEVSPFGELTYERALRSILRQDPQVLMLGEIRDRATASLAVQAALSGHRLVSTLHASTPGSAIARLLEMEIEPYQIASTLFAVVSQRLVRRKESDGSYRGRAPVAELALLSSAMHRPILDRADAHRLQESFQTQPGYQTLPAAGLDLVRQGITDQAEIDRVLGVQA